MSSIPLFPSQSLTLAYTIPLLCASVILTFAGAFLTLDRTRSFATTTTNNQWFRRGSHGRIATRYKRWLRLQGGVGGLCVGFSFGQVIFTLLALLIERSDMTRYHLSPNTFVALSLLSASICSVLAGLFRPITLIMSGLAGGLSCTLGVSIITHPPLIGRLVVLAIFECALLTLVYLPKSRHIALRASLAIAGSFGVVYVTSILCAFDGWSNPFERLWMSDGGNWGSVEEHGLSALASLLVPIGCCTDWFLKKKFGEDPDERWDSILANFGHSLPTRAGVFSPIQPWYTRMFLAFRDPASSEEPPIPGSYPTDLESKPPLTFMPTRAKTKLRRPIDKPKRVKDMSAGFKRDPLVFSPLSNESESDSDSEDSPTRNTRPVPSHAMTASTLVEHNLEENPRNKNHKEVDLADLNDPPPMKELGVDWKDFWSAVTVKAGKD